MGKILETVVSITGEIDPSVSKSIDGLNKRLNGFSKKTLLTAASLAIVGAAAVKAARMAYDLGAEFDQAFDTIRIGTGATGQALEDLKNDFKDVYNSVPADMEKTSKAIADYNTRLGLTGKALQDVSKDALLLSENLGGGDLDGIIKSSSTAMQAWNVSADNMGSKMDFVFKVSQSTGMGFTELNTSLQQFAPALQDLGYDFDHAATLIGSLEKSGLNTAEVLGAMKKAVANLAKEGISAKEGLQDYWTKIKETGDATEAAALASELFGTRAGPTMASAIRSGKMEIDQLTTSLQNNGENIQSLAWETMDAAEKWTILKHNGETAIEPIASALFDLINSAMPGLLEFAKEIAPTIQTFAAEAAPKIQELGTFLKDAAGFAIDFAASISDNWGIIAPIIAGVTTALGLYELAAIAAAASTAAGDAAITAHNILLGIQAGVTGVTTAATTALGAAMAFLTSPIGLVVLAIAAAVAIGVALYQNWDTVCAVAGSMGAFLASVWASITEGVAAMASGIASFFSGAFDTVSGIINGFVASAIGAINSVIGAINGISLSIPEWVPVFGGQTWSPNLPYFAAGGFTSGPSIAGEAGTEAIISFNSAYKDANIGYLTKAASMLGIGSSAASISSFASNLAAMNGITLSGGGSNMVYNLGGLTYSPQVTINGTGNAKQDIMQQLQAHSGQLLDLVQQLLAEKEAGSYGANSF